MPRRPIDQHLACVSCSEAVQTAIARVACLATPPDVRICRVLMRRGALGRDLYRRHGRRAAGRQHHQHTRSRRICRRDRAATGPAGRRFRHASTDMSIEDIEQHAYRDFLADNMQLSQPSLKNAISRLAALDKATSSHDQVRMGIRRRHKHPRIVGLLPCFRRAWSIWAMPIRHNSVHCGMSRNVGAHRLVRQLVVTADAQCAIRLRPGRGWE